MNFRFIAGICLILAAVAASPVCALAGGGSLPDMPDDKTGVVWVTMTNTSGPGQEGPVKIAYAMGDVFEINRSLVTEDPVSGIVTVTVNESGPHMYTLSTPETGGDDAYMVNSITVSTSSEELLANHLSFAVVPATANYYADTVPEGKQHEWIDLNWNDPTKDLGLTVYTPDATLGPYSDTADGRKDGRIFLDIASRLNVTAGTWFFRVQNCLDGYTPYSLNTYSA